MIPTDGSRTVRRSRITASGIYDGEVADRTLPELEPEQTQLCTEPMAEDSPFLTVKDQSRLFITPHIAWATVEARQRLMKIIAGQVQEFLKQS